MFKTLHEQDLACSPTGIDDAIAQLEWENRQRSSNVASPSWNAAHQDDEMDDTVEPLAEPSTDEIPWSELAYWLGSGTTGSLDCACSTCQRIDNADCELCASANAGGYYLYIPGSFYSRLSFKIPVIQLPRIEGIN